MDLIAQILTACGSIDKVSASTNQVNIFYQAKPAWNSKEVYLKLG